VRLSLPSAQQPNIRLQPFTVTYNFDSAPLHSRVVYSKVGNVKKYKIAIRKKKEHNLEASTMMELIHELKNAYGFKRVDGERKYTKYFTADPKVELNPLNNNYVSVTPDQDDIISSQVDIL